MPLSANTATSAGSSSQPCSTRSHPASAASRSASERCRWTTDFSPWACASPQAASSWAADRFVTPPKRMLVDAKTLMTSAPAAPGRARRPESRPGCPCPPAPPRDGSHAASRSRRPARKPFREPSIFAMRSRKSAISRSIASNRLSRQSWIFLIDASRRSLKPELPGRQRPRDGDLRAPGRLSGCTLRRSAFVRPVAGESVEGARGRPVWPAGRGRFRAWSAAEWTLPRPRPWPMFTNGRSKAF